MIPIIVLLLCILLFVLFSAYLVYSWLTKTAFYPSSTSGLQKVLEKLEIDLKDKSFIDVGSGDGRFVIWAAKQGFAAFGIEYNPFLTLYSRLKIFLNGQGKKAKIFNENFQTHNFSNYNIVYLYIFPSHLNNLKPKLYKELEPGSVIITNTFKFSGIEVDKTYGNLNVYYIK